MSGKSEYVPADEVIQRMREKGEPTPILVIDGRRYYSRIFFLGDDEKDWLAALFRDPDSPWRFCSRFRYYAGPNVSPWLYEADGGDRKSTMEFAVPPNHPKQQMLKFIRAIANKAQELGFGDGNVHELILETSDTRTIFRALEKEKWCHLRVQRG